MEGPDTPLPTGSNGPHVFVADVAAPTLAPADESHLRRSLRMRDGDPLTVSDGAGAWRGCRLGPTLEPTTGVAIAHRPTPTLTIAFALTKGSKPEFVVQKLTELGVDVMVPFVAARSIPRWDAEREAKNLARLRRVGREAAMQCRRTWLPDVRPVATFAEACALDGAVRADMAGDPLADEATLLIGPEGGWSDDECAALRSVRLGPHVLRAETAAVAAAVLVGHRHRAAG